MRRRVPETVGAGKPARDTTESKNPLIEQGFQLYHEAEQDGFNNNTTLVNSLKLFIQAAENGADEASQWIKSFLDSATALPASVVLPDHLVKIMRWVADATTEEKQINTVAKSMFCKMANGKSAIREDEIDESAARLLTPDGTGSGEIAKSSQMLKGSVKKLLKEAIAKSDSKEITEEVFCDVAREFARGDFQAPSFMIEQLTDEQLQDFQQANIVRKVLEYPLHTFQTLKMNLLKQIERRGVKWVWSSFPTKQFYLLLIAYLLPLLTVNFVVSTIATVLFYGSFIAMAISTLQIVNTSEKSFLMIEYSSIFQYFSESGTTISMMTPKLNFLRHAVGPYIAFVVAVAIAISTMGLVHQQLVFNEMLALTCFAFVFGLFLEFELYKYPLTLVIVLSRSLSWVYVTLAIVERFFPLPEIVFFGSRKLFSIPIFPSLWLELNLISMIQMSLQTGVIVYSLYQYSWKNFITGLGPIMLFLCWGVLCRNFLYISNPKYIVMTSIGMSVLVASTPFLPIVFLLSPAFFFFYYGATQPFFISLSVVITISLALLFAVLNFKRIKEAKWLNIPVDYLIVFQIMFSIAFIFIGSTMYASIHEPGSRVTVTPAQYASDCIPNRFGNRNSVPTEINCYHLKGQAFVADGIIVEVKMDSIIDNGELSLKSLPTPIRTALTCLFGSSKPFCGTAQNSPTCFNTGCNFHHNLQYTFAIELQVSLPNNNPIPATLLAATSFLDTVLKLQSGTYLKFNSTFVSGMGSEHVTLQAQSLTPENEDGIDIGNLNEIEDQESLFSRFLVSLKKTVYLLLEIVFAYAKPVAN